MELEILDNLEKPIQWFWAIKES